MNIVVINQIPLSRHVSFQNTPGFTGPSLSSMPATADETQALEKTQLLDEVSGASIARIEIAFGKREFPPAGLVVFPCFDQRTWYYTN